MSTERRLSLVLTEDQYRLLRDSPRALSAEYSREPDPTVEAVRDKVVEAWSLAKSVGANKFTGARQFFVAYRVLGGDPGDLVLTHDGHTDAVMIQRFREQISEYCGTGRASDVMLVSITELEG